MKRQQIFLLIASIAILTSCSEKWLDVRSDKSFIVPSTVDELQGLLDNTSMLSVNVMANVLEISTDNLSLNDDQWNSKNTIVRNAYIWAEDIDEGGAVPFWNSCFVQIYYANSVLEGLEKLETQEAESQKAKEVKAQALLFRSWAYFNLLQLFAKQYDDRTADEDLAVPIRTSSDMFQKSERSSVRAVYDFLTDDINESLTHLPPRAVIQTRPSKAAAYGLLARVNLQQGKYLEAKKYADSTLAIIPELMDYSTYSQSVNFPFAQFNEETIFYQTMSTTVFYVDDDMVNSYEENDLRKYLFFRREGQQWRFKGSYANSSNFFSGMATNEFYLVRAECLARLGDYEAARQDMTTLLEKRTIGEIVVEEDNDKLLDFILDERRKELIYRGIRWLDLRRLNQDPNRQVVLRRTVAGQMYELPPNSTRYVFAFPQDIIANNPGMPQNERRD